MALLESLLDELFTASWRGVEFAMLDSRRETGRRWVRFFFPGRDQTVHEDLGAFDGPIHVQGLLIGDDYVRQAQKLEAAFRATGPATLVHPWYGEIECVLAEPGVVVLSQNEYRVARFEASFEPWVERPQAQADTLSQVLDAIDGLRYQLRSWLRTVLAPVRLAIAVVGAVQSLATSLIGTVSRMVLSARGAGTLLVQLTAPFAGLASIGGLTPNEAFADAVADRTAAAPAVIVAATATAATPAIGTNTAAATPDLTPRAAAQLLLDLAAATAPAASASLPAVALAGCGYALAAAIEAASAIAYESQQEAEAWRQRLDAALAALAALVAAYAARDPLGAGPLWRAIATLRQTVAADMQVRSGRLPNVSTFILPHAAPAWLVAQHLAGDDPGRVLAQYRDLVTRNRIRHPAQLPGGVPLERLT